MRVSKQSPARLKETLVSTTNVTRFMHHVRWLRGEAQR